MKTKPNWSSMRREVKNLLIALKPEICDEFRVSDDADDDRHGMQVTIATRDGSKWSYQTGDNSFTGGCYGYPYWACIYLYRRSNCAELAREAVEELEGLVSEAETCESEKGNP